MEGLGEFLRSGREKAGISLDDLAQRTRIRVENLESLEREDFDNLPSDAYVRGFVRQICREVGLPPNDGLVRYDMLRAESGPPDEITWAEERVEETHGRLERALEDPERVVRIARKGGRWAGTAALVAVVALVGVFTWRAIGRGPAAEVTARADGAAPPAAVAAPVDAGGPARDAASPTRGTEVAVTPPETQSAVPHGPPTNPGASDPALGGGRPSTARSEPAKAAKPPAPPRPGPETANPGSASKSVEMSRAALDSGIGAIADLGSAPAARPSALMELRASRAVDVTVLLDGRGAERHARLEAGERRHWKADGHFVLTASDGGALRVFLNGADLGPAGDDGRPTMRTIGTSPR